MNAPPPDEIDVQTLDRLRQQGEAMTVLDIREPWEFEICHLSDSLHIPMQQLPTSLDRLPADGILVVVCHHGARSAQAAEWLRRNGVEQAVNLAGGVDAWSRQIDPSMGVY